MPFDDSQDTTLTFDGTEYKCTNIQRATEGGGDVADQRIDVSTLDLASGSCRVFQEPPLVDCGVGGSDGKTTFTVDFYGSELIPVNKSATLVIQDNSGDAAADIFNGKATCTSCSTTWAVGELVVGNATFSVDEDS